MASSVAVAAVKCSEPAFSAKSPRTDDEKMRIAPIKVRVGVSLRENRYEHHNDLFGCTVQSCRPPLRERFNPE